MPTAVERFSWYTAAATALLGLSACGEGLPQEERIASTRPLAVKLEAIESAPDPDTASRAEVMPFETVRVTPFIVDPNGPLDDGRIADELGPTWIACHMLPVQALGACLRAALPMKLSEIPDCVVPNPADFDPASGVLPEAPTPCRITTGTPASPELTVPIDPLFLLGGDIELTMLAGEPGTDAMLCTDRYLSKSNNIPRDCMFVTQRVPIGPDAALIQLAQDLGFGGEELGPTPDEIPEPDRNLRLVSFEVAVVDPQGNTITSQTVPLGGSVQARQGQTLELTATIPDSDLQSYLIADDDGQFFPRDEHVFGSWFVTWGELLNDDSQEPRSLNEWTLEPTRDDPDEPPSHARLFYVARDGRTGVDWWWIEVEIVP